MSRDERPELIGRQAEMEQLAALARRAAAGRGATVLVEGEPGIGKTALLDAVVADCAQLGMRVLRGAAEELEQHLPFATIGTCLGAGTTAEDADAAHVAALLRGDGAFGHSEAAANYEFVVTEAILDLLDRWCAAGPVALVVDDLQWLDASSMVVLNRLGRGIEQQPLLMVLATRSVARGGTVTGLLRGLLTSGARSLAVTALPDAAVAELVARLVVGPAGPGLLGLVRGASGNPMYLAEFVAALSRDGAIETVDGVAELAADIVDRPRRWIPRSLVEAIQRRLDFLPGKVRETLEMAAVLGPTIDVTELSTVLDVSVMALSEIVAEAMAAGLLVEAGPLLLFRHNVIREALAEHQPVQVRTALHLRAGQVLAVAGGPVERVAEHLLAGTMLERSTIDWLVGAAEALIVRAPELAVRLLYRALGTADGDTADGLRFHLVRALLWAGVLVEAEQSALAALAAGRQPTREGALRWLLAQARYRQGRVREALAVVEEALSSTGLTPTEVGRFHGFASVCLLLLERFDACENAAQRAITAGDTGRDPIAAGYGYNTLAAWRALQGELDEALVLTDKARAALDAGSQPDLEVDPYAIRGACLVVLDRLDEADDALAGAVRHNQRAGAAYLAMSYLLRARLRVLDGRWDDALAEIQAGLDTPDPYGYAVGLPSLAAWIAIHRGAVPPDASQLADADDSLGNRVFGYLPLLAKALGEEHRGNPRQALDLLYPAWAKAPGLQPRHLIYEICPDIARLAAAAGDRDCAHELAATVQALAGRTPSHSMAGTALLCQGLADDDADLLMSAALAFHQAGRPLHEGYAAEYAAVLLAGSGRTAQAREALDRALALYAGLDAAWDIARVTARLRQVGVHRGRTGTRKRPKHGWEALTDTEHKIALLVAEGRSNPDIATALFLSRRTVQSHISNILGKLGLRSRVELAVSALRRAAD